MPGRSNFIQADLQVELLFLLPGFLFQWNEAKRILAKMRD